MLLCLSGKPRTVDNLLKIQKSSHSVNKGAKKQSAKGITKNSYFIQSEHWWCRGHGRHSNCHATFVHGTAELYFPYHCWLIECYIIAVLSSVSLSLCLVRWL